MRTLATQRRNAHVDICRRTCHHELDSYAEQSARLCVVLGQYARCTQQECQTHCYSPSRHTPLPWDIEVSRAREAPSPVPCEATRARLIYDCKSKHPLQPSVHTCNNAIELLEGYETVWSVRGCLCVDVDPGAKGEQLLIRKEVDVVRRVDCLRDPVNLVRNWPAAGVRNCSTDRSIGRTWDTSAQLCVILNVVYAVVKSSYGK